MPNYSHITVAGHLGKDAETRFLANDKAVVQFSVAFSRRRKSRDGEKTEVTTWFRCEWWGERATKVAEYLKKGKAVLVSGECHLEEYEKDGAKRQALKIDVRDLVLLGGREDGEHKPATAIAAPIVPTRTAGDATDEPPFARSELELMP